jgi:hypothetical protein
MEQTNNSGEELYCQHGLPVTVECAECLEIDERPPVEGQAGGEDAEDLATIAERKDEPRTPLSVVLDRLGTTTNVHAITPYIEAAEREQQPTSATQTEGEKIARRVREEHQATKRSASAVTPREWWIASDEGWTNANARVRSYKPHPTADGQTCDHGVHIRSDCDQCDEDSGYLTRNEWAGHQADIHNAIERVRCDLRDHIHAEREPEITS